MLLMVLIALAYSLDFTKIPRRDLPPLKRQHSSMIYLNTLNALYVSGGNFGTTKSYNDIWAYYFDKDTWEKLSPYSSIYPEARYNAGSFVYDSSRICFFGGLGENGPLQDTWCFYTSGMKVSYN